MLDEIEKAHRDVVDIFYQVFDKGVMRDGEGREIDFRNTIIIMTTNLAAETLQQIFDAQAESGESISSQEMCEAIKPDLYSFFTPALIGRMAIVPFRPLTRASIGEIVRMQLDELLQRMEKRHGIRFEYSDDAVDAIAAAASCSDQGARQVKSLVDRQIVTVIASEIISRTGSEQMPDVISLFADENGLAFDLSGKEPLREMA